MSRRLAKETAAAEVVARCCSRCGAGEDDLQAHLVVDPKTGAVVHYLSGLFRCGELVRDEEAVR